MNHFKIIIATIAILILSIGNNFAIAKGGEKWFKPPSNYKVSEATLKAVCIYKVLVEHIHWKEGKGEQALRIAIMGKDKQLWNELENLAIALQEKSKFLIIEEFDDQKDPSIYHAVYMLNGEDNELQIISDLKSTDQVVTFSEPFTNSFDLANIRFQVTDSNLGLSINEELLGLFDCDVELWEMSIKDEDFGHLTHEH